MGNNRWNEPETGRLGEFCDTTGDRVVLDGVLASVVKVGIFVTKILPRLACTRQDPSFTSERNRSFGLVFFETGPVTAIAWDVVRT